MTKFSSTILIRICAFEIGQFCNEFEFWTQETQVVLNKEINQETVDVMYVRCTYIFCSLPLI